MKVLLDTNIMMDALQERSPFDIEAKEILKRAQNGEITCMFTANAVADIFYLYSKARDRKSAREAVRFLLSRYKAVTVTQKDCVAALSLPIEDFEDALAAVCAQKAEAGCIVTRDELFLQASSPVTVLTPQKLLNMLP